jgi:hypothetical protein
VWFTGDGTTAVGVAAFIGATLLAVPLGLFMIGEWLTAMLFGVPVGAIIGQIFFGVAEAL